MKMKKLIAMLLVLALIAADMAAIAEGILTLPKALKVIEEEAFSGTTGVEKIVVPEGTTEIKSRAFAGSSAKEIELPSTLTDIADDAFDGCEFDYVRVPEGCYAYEWALGKGLIENASPIDDFRYEVVDEGIQITAYIGNDAEVRVPSRIEGITVAAIGDGAFANCTQLTSVALPKTVTIIGTGAFQNCINLADINIDEGIKSLYQSAFQGCTSLKKLELPTSLTYIHKTAFDGCANLTLKVYQSSDAYQWCVNNKFTSYELFTDALAAGYCGEKGDNLKWKLLSDYTLVISGEGRMADFDYTTAPWENCKYSMKAVVIEEGVSYVGQRAFYNSGITAISFPGSVTEIGREAVRYCSKIKSIQLPEGIKEIGYGAFQNCSGLTSVSLPASLESIGSYAFYECGGLTAINIPANVSAIGEYAFVRCALLENINAADNNGNYKSLDGVLYSKDGKKLICYPYARATGSIAVPAGVELIGQTAFADCRNLTNVILPESVTEIEGRAFNSCSAMTDISFGGNLTTIGEYAFSACYGLESIELPDSVVSIGKSAFSSCQRLANVELSVGLKEIGAGAFSGCSSLTSIALPDGMTAIAESAFSGCRLLESISIPDSVQYIGKMAFYCCYALKEIDIPEGVSVIYENTFDRCQSLTSITLPESITEIREYAFNFCEGLQAVYAKDLQHWLSIEFKGMYSQPMLFAEDLYLNGGKVTNVVLPVNIESLGAYAFAGCSGLTSVTLPESLLSIGESAFLGCTGLTQIDLPSGITEIGAETFAETGISEMTLPAGVAVLNSRTFADCVNLEQISLPEGLTSIGFSAFANCKKLSALEIPDSVQEIKGHAFSGCSGLISVNVPEGVPEIGHYTFNGCSSLEKLLLPESVEYIGNMVFTDCTKLRLSVYENSYAHNWCETRNMAYDLQTKFTAEEYFTSKVLADGTLSVTGYTGEDMDIVIPSTIGGVQVTEIGANAFNPSDITSVVIPEGVTTIGNRAFRCCCDMTEVSIPSTVTHIGEMAFHCCESLTELTIPAGVTEIGTGAFSGCGMSTFEIPEGITSISDNAFEGCHKLTSITIPDSVTSVGAYAFQGCNLLKEITLPNSVTSVGDYAFYDSGLERIVLPESLKQIGSSAFMYSRALTEVVLPEGLTAIGSKAFRNCTSLESVTIPSATVTMGEEIFFECTSLSEVVLPESLAAVPNYCFYRCSSLDEISLPASIESIGEYAFFECTNLTQIDLPDNAKAIKSGAFYGSGLNSITIPGSEIESYAFIECNNLTEVIISEGTKTIGYKAFADCPNLTSVFLPKSLTSIDGDAFASNNQITVFVHENSYAHTWCETKGVAYELRAKPTPAEYFTTNELADGTLSITGYTGEHAKVIIPDQIDGIAITAIASSAFDGCSTIESIVIPEGITSIGMFAFNDCESLTNITLPAGLVSIGDLAFQSCDLRSVVIPYGVESLGWNIFNNNLSLEKAIIPTSVKSAGKSQINWNETGTGFTVSGDIEGYTFYHWTEIKEVIILEGCTSIGEGAFMECTSLESVSIPESVRVMDSRIFADCESLTDVNIPDNVTELGDFVFSWCNISDIELPSKLEKIGRCAFQRCWNLTEIEIPYGVKSIGDAAFLSCINLNRIVIPSTVEEILGDILKYGDPDVVIAAPIDSFAIEYAQNTGYKYEIIDEIKPDLTLGIPQLEIQEKTHQAVTITWNAVEGAEAYDVYYANELNGAYAYIGTTQGNLFVHNNLKCNTTYYYRVCAMSETLTSEYSNVLVVTTEDQSISLSAPKNVAVSTLSENSLIVSWDSVVNAEGYYVVADEVVIAEISGIGNCSFTMEELEPETEYLLSIKAYSYKNNGEEVIGAESSPIVGRTAAELLVEAVVSNSSLEITDAITVNASVSGTFGSFAYRYTIRKDGEIVNTSGECTDAQYSYIPTAVGTYSVIVVVNDSLGRTSGCQIDGIEVKAEDLEIFDTVINKSVIMLGETVTITSDSNRFAENLTYSANVYCEDVKVDQIVGIGKLTYIPESVGAYSFAIEITDSYGETRYVHLGNAVTVRPFWDLTMVTTDKAAYKVGEKLTITAEVTGATEELNYLFEIKKDGAMYRRVEEMLENKYSISLCEAGLFSCTVTVTDKYGNTTAKTSKDIVVANNDAVNENKNTATYGNTLNVSELNDMDEDDVRVNAGTVTVTWDKGSGDSYYELYISCPQKNMVIVENDNYKGNSYVIPSAQIHKGYRYSVYVDRYSSTGEYLGDLSMKFAVAGGNSLMLEDDIDIISPASNASANYDDLTIHWEKMNYVKTFEIRLEYNCGCDWHEILTDTVDGNASSYTIPKSVLQDGKRHHFEINAIDALGYDDDDYVYFFVGCEDEESVIAIKEPVLTSAFLEDGYLRNKITTYPVYEPITITWEENPYSSYFSLSLKDFDDGNKEILYNNIIGTSYTVQPSVLISGHRYRIAVTAYHNEECFESSEAMWIRAPYKGGLVLNPPEVTSLELSQNENDPTILVKQDLTVTWNAVTAAERYEVCLCENEDWDWIDFEQDNITIPTVTIPKENLGTGFDYALIINAYDANDNATCQEYYLRFIKSSITSPVLLYPNMSTDKNSYPAFAEGDIELTWNTVANAVSYGVKVYDYYDEEWDVVIDERGITGQKFTIPEDELREGRRYRVRLNAVDQYGNDSIWTDATYYFQVGSSKYINLTLKDHVFSYNGGSKNFSLATPGSWTAKISDPWISLNHISGTGGYNMSITVTQNTGVFPRSGSVTFTNSSGGCAVFSVTQAGNGSSNTGALKITSPEQGDTIDYAKFRTHWNYNYDHAYFTVALHDVTSDKTVYSADRIILEYADIPQSALTYGHIYQLAVAAYNAQYNKISESSIVFRVESLSSGSESDSGQGGNDGIIEDTEIPEGVNEIKYTGIEDGAEIQKKDLSVSWQNVIGADSYWVALRDLTLYPDDMYTSEEAGKVIDKETLLNVNILEGQLTEGHAYRLWIGAYKTGTANPLCHESISFSVAKVAIEGEESGNTGTLIPAVTLKLDSNEVLLGDSIALQGVVRANGGILNQIRVTVQNVQTGKFCDYAIYDQAAIGSYGYYDQFDLANMYPIATGEGTYIGTSGSGYARAGSVSLYLDTVGDRYNIVVYGKNNGDEEMHVLASTIITLFSEESEITGGTVSWNNHTYRLIDESMTWTQAKAYCESLGGYLVTITSADEQQIIEKLLASSGTKNLYWIGLNESLKSLWITGESSDYTNWCPGEPNGSGEKYGEIYRDSAWSPAYTWNDSDNDGNGSSFHSTSNHGLICEFGDVVVVPEENNFTLNSTAKELTVSVGDTLTFAGEIRAGSAQLVNVQASLLDADDPTKGIKFDRIEDIYADSFDLSGFKSILVGKTYSDEKQSITMEAGKSYIVMLHVADANGVGFTDRDLNTEGPQGPSILVHVEEAEDAGSWNGHTYKVIDQSMTWMEAKAYCESLGGYLATITSAEEQEAVANVLSRYGSKNVYWIGLYEKGEDSVWVTGEEYSYSNWSSGEPNDNDEVELYTEMYRTSTWHGDAYEWNDSSNTANSQDFYSISNHGLICEFGGIANGPSAEGFELSAGSITEGDVFSISGSIKGNGSNVTRVTISAFVHDDHTVGVHLQSLEGNGEKFDLSQFSPIRTDCVYSDNEGRIMSLSGGNTYDIVIYATLANGEYFRNDTNPTQTIVVNKETVDVPDVLSVKFDSASIAVNEDVGITVETDEDAEQLYMYAEDRSWGRCGSWATFDSDTTVEGSKRIWNINYAFNTTGDRTLTFYASKDGRNEGEGCAASIEVYEPVYTGISVEDFTLSQHFVQTGDTIELNGVVRGHGSNLSEVAIMLVENESWDNAVYIASYALNDESFDLGEETHPIVVGETYGRVSTYRLTSRSTASDSITMADGNDYQVVVRAVLESGEVLNDGYGYSRFLRVQNNPDDTEIALEKVEFTYVPEKVNLYEAREGIDVTWDDSQMAFFKLEYKLDTESEYRYIINNYGHQTLYFTNVGAAKEVQLRLSAVSGSEAGEATTETISIQTLGELSFVGYTIGENDVFDISRSSALIVPVVCENAVEYKIKGIFLNEYPSGSDQLGKAVDTITSRIEGNVISIPRIEFMQKLAGLITTDSVKAPYFKLAVTPYDEEGNAGTTRWIGFKLVNGREPAARVSFNNDLPEMIESGKTVTISWTPTSNNVLYYNLYYRHSTWEKSKAIRVEAPYTSAQIEVSSTKDGVVFLSLYAVLTNDNHSHVDKSIAFKKSAIEARNSLIPFQQTDSRWNSIPYGLYASAGKASAHTAYIGLDYVRGYGQEGYPGCTAHANCGYLNKENSHYYGSGCGILSTFNALYALNDEWRTLDDEEIVDIIEDMAEYSLSNGLRVNGVGTSHAFPSKYINTHFASDYIVEFANLGNSRAINEREWGEIDTCLKSGGAVVINVPGHFMAIVGIRQDDDTGYTQYLLWDSAKNKNRKTNNDGRAWLTKGDFAGEKLTIRDYTTITPR